MRVRYKRLMIVAAFMLLMTALVTMIGCAPRPAEAKSGGGNSSGSTAGTEDPSGPVVNLPAWSMSSDCTSCHAAEVASATDSTTVYSIHATEPGVSCTTCHTDDDGTLTEGHQNYSTASDPTKLRRSSVSDTTCLVSGCHSESDLIAATADLTLLTDSNGLTVNPHDVPDTRSHDYSTSCSACHKQHVSSPNLERTAEDLCLSCHHEHVYECNTCHN